MSIFFLSSDHIYGLKSYIRYPQLEAFLEALVIIRQKLLDEMPPPGVRATILKAFVLPLSRSIHLNFVLDSM